MRYPAILAPVLATAAVLGAAMAAPASAQAPEAVTVRHSDLDLSTEAGQAQLERRIDRAARAACGLNEVSTGTRLPTGFARQCYNDAKARVHEQVAEAIARSDRG